jgi:hypothetical protein
MHWHQSQIPERPDYGRYGDGPMGMVESAMEFLRIEVKIITRCPQHEIRQSAGDG